MDDTSDNDSNAYDVYYTLYGKTQEITEEIDNCTRCLLLITPKTRELDELDKQCIGNNYKCGVKLAMQSIIKAFDYTNNNMDDHINGKYYRAHYNSNNNQNLNDMTIININITPNDVNNGNLYGVTSFIDPEYDYLMGEWRLNTSIIHNENYVWTKYDKYRRDLKLFLYDNNDSKRWIVGHNLTSDAAYIYAPLLYHQQQNANLYVPNPINIIHNEWLYHNNSIQQWKKLRNFRFSPSSFLKPQLQSISIKNHSLIHFDENTKIIFTFTHFIEIDNYGEIDIFLVNQEKTEFSISAIIKGGNKQVLKIIDDKLIITNLSLQQNSTFILSISENLVYSTPRTPNNGNDKYDYILYFTTAPAAINWNYIATQYLKLAKDILVEKIKIRTNKTLEINKKSNESDTSLQTPPQQQPQIVGDDDDDDLDDFDTDNDVVEINLIISLFQGLLYIDQNNSPKMNLAFNKFMDAMSGYLSIKKQIIINKNESFLNNEQLQLLKSKYYLQLTQVNLLKAYHYLLLNDKENCKKYMDKSLKMCIKQYYGSNKGKQYNFVEDLITNGQYNTYYCNFHTFDTYFVLQENSNFILDKYDLSYFINTIKIRWTVREYLYRFHDDLSVLFPNEYNENMDQIIVDNLNNKIEFESHHGPRYDILFGLRNLNLIRNSLAKYGIVQVKNFLNLIECQWLKNYYLRGQKMKNKNMKFTNDRIAYVYLQEFGEILSYLIGHNVKKTYSIFVDFNSTNFYDSNIGQTLRNDNKYTILLTINMDLEMYGFPFPIYFHKQLVPSKKKQFHITNYNQNYEFINNIGDAIIFKGTQHIHFAPYTKKLQAHNYWVLLFHYVDLDYDFNDYKKRF